MSGDPVDVVILTAISLEYRAALQVDAGARDAAPWLTTTTAEGLPLAFRTFRGKNERQIRIALTQAGDMGMVAATSALLPLIMKHEPKCVAMSGVCAGRPGKTNLGDVVAAERLFFHDTGKQLPDDVERDLRTYNLRDDWKIALEHFDFVDRFRDQSWWQERPIPYEWQENWILVQLREGISDPSNLPDCDKFCQQWEKVIEALWKKGDVRDGELVLTDQGRARIQRVLVLHRNRIPELSPAAKLLPFKAHVAPMGSGNKVVEDSSIWGFVSEHMRKTLGLEMEAASLGALVHTQRSRRLDALVMKGVMDFANDGRDDHFKDFAARASAECLIAFLREHLDADVGRRTVRGDRVELTSQHEHVQALAQREQGLERVRALAAQVTRGSAVRTGGDVPREPSLGRPSGDTSLIWEGNNHPFEFRVHEETATCTELMRSVTHDVVKVQAHSDLVGVAAEHAWIQHKYPNSTMVTQGLVPRNLTIGSGGPKRRIFFDEIRIKLKDGREKNVIFDISSFFDGRSSSHANPSDFIARKISGLYGDIRFESSGRKMPAGALLRSDLQHKVDKKLAKSADGRASGPLRPDIEREIKKELAKQADGRAVGSLRPDIEREVKKELAKQDASPQRLDPSWQCPRCHAYGPWDGTRCLSCGTMSDPNG